MSKKIIKIILNFVWIVFLLSFSKEVLATAGGPTLFSDFGYSEKEKAVYFIKTYHDAMGGSTIGRYNLLTDKVEFILDRPSFGEEEWENFEIEVKRKEIWRQLKPLSRIDLIKNGFKIEIPTEYLKMNEEEYHDVWMGLELQPEISLKAEIFQNDKKISEIEFITCGFYNIEKDEIVRNEVFEVNFDGFFIPNSNSILLLVSTEADCFEYGYVVDEIFVLKNVEIIDPAPIIPLSKARRCEGIWRDIYPPYMSAICPTPGGIFISFPNIFPVIVEEEAKPQSRQVSEKVLEERGFLFIIFGILAIVGLSLILLIYLIRKSQKTTTLIIIIGVGLLGILILGGIYLYFGWPRIPLISTPLLELEEEKECEEMINPLKRDACFQDIAIAKQEVFICGKIRDQFLKDNCYKRLALAKKDLSICERIFEKIQDRCYFYLALEKQDSFPCEKIKEESRKDRCYKNIAEAKQDLSICDKIKDQEIRESCYRQISP